MTESKKESPKGLLIVFGFILVIVAGILIKNAIVKDPDKNAVAANAVSETIVIKGKTVELVIDRTGGEPATPKELAARKSMVTKLSPKESDDLLEWTIEEFGLDGTNPPQGWSVKDVIQWDNSRYEKFNQSRGSPAK
jgi:hypothetical protein